MLYFAIFSYPSNQRKLLADIKMIILLIHIALVALKLKKYKFYPIFQVLICKLEALFAWLPHINATHMACPFNELH